jgi:hypothetical protein
MGEAESNQKPAQPKKKNLALFGKFHETPRHIHLADIFHGFRACCESTILGLEERRVRNSAIVRDARISRRKIERRPPAEMAQDARNEDLASTDF